MQVMRLMRECLVSTYGTTCVEENFAFDSRTIGLWICFRMLECVARDIIKTCGVLTVDDLLEHDWAE